MGALWGYVRITLRLHRIGKGVSMEIADRFLLKSLGLKN